MKKLIAAGVLVLAGLFPGAQASVIVLTGGDAGEGYAPGSGTIYAYRFTHFNLSQATSTIQGVSFLPFNTVVGGGTIGNVSLVNGNPYPAVGTDIGATANDNALEGLGSAIVYGQTRVQPGAMNLTIGGLTPGSAYQLDLFWFYQSFVVPATYTITDANGQKFNSVPGVGGTYYNVRESVVATGLGQVSVLVTNFVGSFDFPYLNAFSVTIPEPGTLLLLGLGGALVWRRQRS